MKHAKPATPATEHARFAVKGDVIGQGFDRLREKIELAVAQGAGRLLIDLSGVGAMEPVVLQYLLETAEQMAAGGGWLKLLNGGPICTRMIHLTTIETFSRQAWAGNAAPADGETATTPDGEQLWVKHRELAAV